jgi:hypothetical protein
MNVAELDAKLRPLLSAAVELQCELSDSDPDVELAVALGALSSVVVILQSLLPRESSPPRNVRLGCSAGCGFGVLVERGTFDVTTTGATDRKCDRCGAHLCVWEYDG